MTSANIDGGYELLRMTEIGDDRDPSLRSGFQKKLCFGITEKD
jgi:hypothetical protein